jgi:dTDP-glucose pyrophosphorylase/CBS domain-containing protein
MFDARKISVTVGDSVETLMRTLDAAAKGIALVVDPAGRLMATVTDGDIRRAILQGCRLTDTTATLLEYKRRGPASQTPVTAPADASPSELLHIMNQRSVRHLPLLTPDEQVVGVALLSELVEEYEAPLEALIMAGGRGTRLYPLTADMPKPMLPVGDRPLLEHIVGQLREAGIQRVSLATHYQADKIHTHFGDGSRFGVEINYVAESEPLGTAGALGLLEGADKPILVLNGDIVTKIDFRRLHDFHREHAAAMTVGVRQYDVKVPYGVVEVSGPLVTGLREKPVLEFMVNAGIYLIEPRVRQVIPRDRAVDMPEVIQIVLDQGEPVASFPIVEYWLDIGRPEDYDKAQRAAE